MDTNLAFAMPLNLHNTTAVVTGASRGIGEAIARTLAAEGARVALVSRSGDQISALASSLPNDAIAIEADLATDRGWRTVVREALDSFADIDILVNNAAVFHSDPLGKLTSEHLDETLNVNVRNIILLTHGFSASLIRRRGCVINVSSVSSYGGLTGQIAYSSSKGAINAFTRNASVDLGRFGVRVNAVAPGLIDDGMWKTAFSNGLDRNKTMARMRSLLPLEGRWGTAQNVADCVAWLASSKAAYVTGQVIRVDGGMLT